MAGSAADGDCHLMARHGLSDSWSVTGIRLGGLLAVPRRQFYHRSIIWLGGERS